MSRRGPVLEASGSQRQEGEHSNSLSSNSAFYSYPSTSYHPIQHLQFHSIHNPSNHPQLNPSSFSFSTASSSSLPPSYPSSKPRPSSCHTQELHSPTYISSSNQSHNLSLSCINHPEGTTKESQSQMMTYPSGAASASQVQLKHQGQQQTSTVPPHPSTYSQTGILPPLRTSSPDGNSYRSYSYEEPILQHHRNLSLSSQHSLPIAPGPSTSSHSLQSTPNDLSDSWSSLPTSTRSRTGSTFSLTGHLEGMGMSNGSGTDSPPLNPNPSQFPIRAQLPHLYSNDRRSSLDDRSVATNAPIRNFSWDNYSRDPPQIPTPPNLNLSQTGGGNNSRNWPWPAAPLHPGYGGPHLRHSSVSGAPIQYEPHYSRAGGMGGIVGGVGSSYQHSFPQPAPLVGGHHHQEWMSNGNQIGNGFGMGGSASSVGRIRSASGSAMGRFAQHPYGMGMDPVDYMDQNSIDPLYSSNPSTSSLSTSTSKATGTGTPRRTKFKRSRTGCIMCRKRKVKCSQDGSPCKQCRTGKRECVYEAVPPKRKRTTKKSTAAVAPTVQSQEMSNSETVSSSDTNGYHDLRRLSTATAGTDASSSSPSSGSLANHSGVSFTMPFDSNAGSAGTGWSGTPPPPLANSIHSGSPTSNDSHSQNQPHYTLSSIHDPPSHTMPSANPPAVDARYQSSASYHPSMHHQSIHSASSHLGHNSTAPYYHSEYISPLEPPSNYASSGYAGSDAAYSMESARSR